MLSTERAVNILHTHLCMRKLCAISVLRLLTIDQKRICVTTSEQNSAYSYGIFNRKKLCAVYEDVLTEHMGQKQFSKICSGNFDLQDAWRLCIRRSISMYPFPS